MRIKLAFEESLGRTRCWYPINEYQKRSSIKDLIKTISKEFKLPYKDRIELELDGFTLLPRADVELTIRDGDMIRVKPYISVGSKVIMLTDRVKMIALLLLSLMIQRQKKLQKNQRHLMRMDWSKLLNEKNKKFVIGSILRRTRMKTVTQALVNLPIMRIAKKILLLLMIVIVLNLPLSLMRKWKMTSKIMTIEVMILMRKKNYQILWIIPVFLQKRL
ncbi:hypothetical protein C2G38_1774116 [Gigaspora rosea]|uniref:Coilin N-terminal domain-containing protein n=1 Tax=Gigaspora rosea TaxID=44941 RepID=A0A397URW1_9GLOM|nr:hypothetical protein C2G38_1774116 [Gigaspora rosea]